MHHGSSLALGERTYLDLAGTGIELVTSVLAVVLVNSLGLVGSLAFAFHSEATAFYTSVLLKLQGVLESFQPRLPPFLNISPNDIPNQYSISSPHTPPCHLLNWGPLHPPRAGD